LAKHSKNISDDGIKLKIYAYYKQSTIGDCNTEKPQIFDLMGRTKWNAWDQMRGVSKK
jgi:diazepam-binding inhibitor (GABA receptor modulating acyl-CoA-binding protein)